jgi:hypothetical protein
MGAGDYFGHLCVSSFIIISSIGGGIKLAVASFYDGSCLNDDIFHNLWLPLSSAFGIIKNVDITVFFGFEA